MVYRKKRFTKRNFKGKKGKRSFYFDATLSKNVPLVGGSHLRFGKRQLQTALKEVAQTKYFYNVFDTASPLKHNTIYTSSFVQQIVQGTGDNNRIGTKIHLDKHLIRFNLQNAAAAGNIELRVMVIWLDTEYGAGPTYTSAVGATDLFQDGGVGGFSGWTRLLDNRKACNVIHDQVYKLNSIDIANQVTIKSFDININYNKIVHYSATTAYFTRPDKQLYVLWIPNVVNGTTGTTDVCTIGAQSYLSFKDY